MVTTVAMTIQKLSSWLISMTGFRMVSSRVYTNGCPLGSKELGRYTHGPELVEMESKHHVACVAAARSGRAQADDLVPAAELKTTP